MERALGELVKRRARDTCEYCRMPASVDPATFEIDHIVARKHGGVTSSENLALSCYACNIHKGPNIAGLDPETGTLTRLFNPRTDQWGEHFCWDGAHLCGRTAEGRTTIAVLCINAPHRLAFRTALMEEGAFSP